MSHPFHDIAIVGVGATHQARALECSTLHACLEAAQLALADAGLRVSDIDGICARWPGPGGTVFHPGSADWAKLLGIPLRWIGDTYPQGVPALLDAAAAIATGLCHTVLIVGGQAGLARDGTVASYTRPENEFTEIWGAMTAAHFALVANVYLDRYAPDRLRLANVAATIRNAGSANPNAVMFERGPYTAQDILDAPMVATPFSRLDLCLATEGAAAVIVTSRERARDGAADPIRILGGGTEWYRQQYVDPPRFDEIYDVGTRAAAAAMAMAGVTPQDIDVCELYDINTFEIVRQLEILGFCGVGEGTDFANDVGIGVDGGCPVNTDGGLMSYSHIGWGGPQLKIVEAVRQLRGTAGFGQVADAEIAIACGAGSGAQYHNSVILGQSD
ncbi:MAG: thiolase family protein [Acidimicrobiia bacterium]